MSALGTDARAQTGPGDLVNVICNLLLRHSLYTQRLLDSLARLTNEMTVPALENASWWDHLLQANLAKVIKIVEERRNVRLCVVRLL